MKSAKHQQSESVKNASRRDFGIGLGAAVLSAPFISLLPKTASAEEPVVIVSWGGTYQSAQEETVGIPFTKQTGIPVRYVSGPDIAKAKAQVRTGNVEWDIFDGTGAQITAGEVDNMWEPVSSTLADPKDMLLPIRKSSVPFLFSVGVIAYVPGRNKPGTYPKNFAQLWDTKNFPGRRGLRTRASETLELALLADGVKPDKLYPLDVERAFASLDKIKSSVAKWIDQTPQTISLLTSNEADFTYTYTGRAYAATKAKLDVATSLDQTLIVGQYYAVLRGSRRKESAMKFIAYALQPEVQARYANALGHLPVRRSTQALLTPEIKAVQPDLANPNNVMVNDTWWAQNFTTVDRRFKEWLAT